MYYPCCNSVGGHTARCGSDVVEHRDARLYYVGGDLVASVHADPAGWAVVLYDGERRACVFEASRARAVALAEFHAGVIA